MKGKKSLHVTKDAKNNTFINCDIEGAQIDGQKTTMVKTRIRNFRKNHPTIWVGATVSLFLTIVGGIIILLIEYNIIAK